MENFSNGISSNLWYLFQKQWGGGNNGLNPKLVSIVKDNVYGVNKNVVKLHGTGDLYTGSSIDGVIKSGSSYPLNPSARTRVGSGLCTVAEYASGSFEVVMKIPAQKAAGMAPSLWTFHYEEHDWSESAGQMGVNPNDLLYRVKSSQKVGSEYAYSVVNSEIDCPEFGFNSDYSMGLYTTYRSLREYKSRQNSYADLNITSIADDKYHRIKTVWRTELRPTDCTIILPEPKQGNHTYCADINSADQGLAVSQDRNGVWSVHRGRSISYFVDGVLVGQNVASDPIPEVNAHFCVALWLPNWAGPAAWDETDMFVSEVNITPFNDDGDVCWQEETYLGDGLVRPSLFGF